MTILRTRASAQRYGRPLVLLALLALLGACTSVSRPGPGGFEYSPSMPQPPVRDSASARGAIYQPALAMNLVGDARAGRVGDIIIVLLQERTQAAKSANTDLSRSTTHSATLGGSGELGSFLGDGERTIDAQQGTEFSGEGDADQSNSLNGQIAVTVAQVLPNGNLVVQGEKWITINQGEEFLRLRGIVRPMDISDDNTVLSTRVADARIAYSGRGSLADASTPSWLTRFFLSAASLF